MRLTPPFFRLLLEPWMLPQGFHPSFLAFSIPKFSRTFALSTRMGKYGRPKVRRRLLEMHRLGIVSHIEIPSNSTSIIERALIVISVLSPPLTQMTWTRDSRGTGMACHICSCYAHHIFVQRSTWFTQDDVNQIQQANLNTVRIPVRPVR